MEMTKLNLPNLPHGFRFNPFEYELITLYLKPKVIGEKLACNIIEERQLYGPDANPWQVFHPENHPWIFSEVSCGKFEKIAYAFVNLTKIAADSNSNNKKSIAANSNSNKKSREHYFKQAGCGTWDGQTKRTEIRDCYDNLIGEKRMLAFEINEVSEDLDLSRVGGHWRMHEYHLCGVNNDVPNLSNTVLCKITLDQSKKPPIKLRPFKANAPEKNKMKKKNTKKLDVSSSLTNSVVVDTFEGISKRCGAFGPCGPRGEELCHEINYVQTCDDDDDVNEWIKSIFVNNEDEDGNLLPEDEQPLVDITKNLGKRKYQAETSCVVNKKVCC